MTLVCCLHRMIHLSMSPRQRESEPGPPTSDDRTSKLLGQHLLKCFGLAEHCQQGRCSAPQLALDSGCRNHLHSVVLGRYMDSVKLVTNLYSLWLRFLWYLAIYYVYLSNQINTCEIKRLNRRVRASIHGICVASYIYMCI